MNLDASRNLQFLSEAQYWMYGPCFKIQFYFQAKRCSPTDFESALLSDPMFFAPPPLSLPMPKEMPSRCILAISNGAKPLGFIYFGGDQGDHDYYYLATYPRQIKRHWGEFHWNGNADDPLSVIQLHTELVSLVRRLHSQLNFHLVVVRDEAAPWFMPPHTSLTGILIYHWLAQQGDFGASEFVECCYALLPLDAII
ncbi:hypothetical protein NDA01_26250 [Trichocoleus desertorum AS-A10]|uniref:hypothetical protein n=1 Tax=Trichocoleus desertorum TaxID=1481672 RepID=UPI003298FC98